MTDPEFADRTYVEPLTAEVLEQIIARERPDALLPTIGGQTALNLAIELAEAGVLERYGVELIGAKLAGDQEGRGPRALQGRDGADRARPAAERLRAQLDEARGDPSHDRRCRSSSARRARSAAPAAASPRPRRSSPSRSRWALAASPTHEVLDRGVDRRLEGVRARGDARRQGQRRHHLLDRELRPDGRPHRRLHHRRAGADADRQGVPADARRRDRASSARSASTPAARTSSSRVNPQTGRLVVIEMNPRVSRSSALASKATGFPIAKIAAKLAVGYTLDEIPNDITRETPACFEPTIDYVVTKIPRFTFEKFPATRRRARPADEVGRRGDGDRPHVQGVAAEGDALARDRTHRLRSDVARRRCRRRRRRRRRRRPRPHARAAARAERASASG